MAGLTIRIPDEVRTYKEKIMFGLNARQLICSVLTLLICVPLYIFGKKIIPEDILSWLVILIACPLMAIGFIKINGLPMEKFAVVWFEINVLCPKKRIYKAENYYRYLQNRGKAMDIPTNKKEKKRWLKEQKEIAETRTFLLWEAEENGMAYIFDPNNHQNGDYDPIADELLTVRKNKTKTSSSASGKSGKSGNGKGGSNKKQTGLEKKADGIAKKQAENPEYLPTEKDLATLKKYRMLQDKKRKQEILAGRKKVVRAKNEKMKKRRNAKTTIPKTVQKSIPIIADYDEGMFEVQPNKYSKAYRVKDINYKIQRYEEAETAFVRFTEFHNYFSEDVRYQIVVDKRVISKAEQERKIFYKLRGDAYDRHRREYNSKVLRKAIVRGNNEMQKEIYVVVTIDADSPFDALMRFHKIDNDVIGNLRRIGSDGEVLTTEERLEYFHDKFRKGREGEFHIDFEWLKEHGISSLDEIAPSYMYFDNKEMKIEDTFYRTMYLTNLPASLSDEFLCELGENLFPTTVSLSVEPIAQDKALRLVRKQMTGIETNKIDAEKRAIKAGYNPDTIQHSIKDAYAHIQETYDDMLNKNQKLFFVNVSVCVAGDSLEELEENCTAVMAKARKYTCQLNNFTMQQEEAWKMTMPFGYIPKNIATDRSLTSEALAVFVPFANQELFQMGGTYYGLNGISDNLVIVNRFKMKTPSGFVLGSSGSGKSFATKRELLSVLLADNSTNVYVIDPENEYCDFCRAFGGAIVKLSPSSDTYINPMDLPLEYGLEDDETLESVGLAMAKEKAIKKKSDYIVSIVEGMMTTNDERSDVSVIDPVQRSIIDRCMIRTYQKYFESDFDLAYLPTLEEFQQELDKEKGGSQEARVLAESVEYYTRGSMNVFAHKTNVDINNRLVVFSIRDLGDTLRQIGLTIVFDYIWSKMIEGKASGRKTFCYADEIHVMFKNASSSNYLNQLYKRGRKYGMCITGITQSVTDLLASEKARGMLANSDFIMMLNQKQRDLEALTELLDISEAQKGFVTGADAGCGLLFAEKVIVPFGDEFPSDTYLYSLMSTKFGEDADKSEVDKLINEIMSKDYEQENVE